MTHAPTDSRVVATRHREIELRSVTLFTALLLLSARSVVAQLEPARGPALLRLEKEMRAALTNNSDVVYQDWGYAKRVDDRTGEDRSSVLAIDVTSETLGILAFQCSKDGLHLQYYVGKYLVYVGREVRVQYRIDKLEASPVEVWNLERDHKRTYMPMHRVPGFREQAVGGNKVVFEVVDSLTREKLQHTFSLRGLSRALEELPCAVDS